MKKTIKMVVENISEAKGTVGWLAHQPIQMEIGMTKSGYAACWLKIAGRSEVIAVSGGKQKNAFTPIEPCPGVHPIPFAQAFAVIWTDAALGKVEEIAETCREKFKDVIEERNAEEEKLLAEFQVELSSK